MTPTATPTATQTANLIASLWERSQPLILQRLDLLDKTAQAVAANALTEPMLDEASTAAHNLAGSLGMFGYHEGTNIARRIEMMLDTPSPDPGELTKLTRDLRASLDHKS